MLKNIIQKILIVFFVINLLLSYKTYDVYAKAQINFKNITIEDGLVQGTVETLFQDSKGYIWIGTNDGLCRYNGYEFKVYRMEEDSENSLINNYILDIKEDVDGNIWVATTDGLSRIHSNGQSITNYADDKQKGNLSNANINTILITKDNNILIGTADGLNIYNKDNDSFDIIFNDNKLVSSYIETLAEDSEGNIWVGTDNGISKINLQTGESISIQHNESLNSISDNEIYKLYYDNKGYIWVGTVNSGACKINLANNEVTRYSNVKNDENSLGGNFIKNFLRDRSGNMWIATENGLSKYNDKNDLFTTFKNKIYDRNSLVDSNVFSLIQDETGLIWIGTYAGISIFNPESEIQHYKSDPFDNTTISNNMVTALYEDKDGETWVGTKYSGIDILNREKDKIINIGTSSDNNILGTDDVYDIVGNENNIFIATNKGITRIDKERKEYKNYTEKDNEFYKCVRSLLYDDGYLWIGTKEGLAILNLETEELINLTYILEKYSPADKYISEIYKDLDGEYWIGMFVQGGLIRINPNDGKVTVYKNIESNKNSLSNNSIRSIVQGVDGEIWIGTSFGLNSLDKKSDRFERYTTKNGMANNTIYGVLIDEYGNPWCSTNIGISKINISTGLISNLDVTDGLQSNEFNGNAFFKNRNGELLFGGINGFNIIDTEKIKASENEYSLVLDSFKVNGLERKIKDVTKLKYYENNIYIEYFLPNYKNVNGTQYYYCLEGGNNEWMDMEGNSITLSNLSPGNYKVKIRARGNNGIISNESELRFAINPPFWGSKYAVIIYIIIIILFLFHNKYKVKKLDNMVEIRTKELSEEMKRNKELFNKIIDLEKRKNSYLINLSHELRTPLNVIYSTEQLIRTLNKKDEGIEKEKLNHYMKILKNNTKRLLKIINDLIDTSKIEHGSYNLDIKDVDIVYVVEEAALSLREYIKAKEIELIVDPEIEEKIIEADKNEIERCIINIVGNAFKFTNAGGFIRVEIKDLIHSVKIEISDNGIGIDKKYHELIFNRFNQVVDPTAEIKKGSGLGLTITKKIIDLHNGHIYVESELGKGSKFIITLPVKQK